MVSKFCVEKVEINGKDFIKFEAMNQLEDIIYQIKNKEITEIVFYLYDKDILLNIFAEGVKFHISIIDEENDINYYYINNQISSEELIEIGGNLFDANMVCINIDILEAIISKFILCGEKYENVEWFEE
jgi:hypothetical protein